MPEGHKRGGLWKSKEVIRGLLVFGRHPAGWPLQKRCDQAGLLLEPNYCLGNRKVILKPLVDAMVGSSLDVYQSLGYGVGLDVLQGPPNTL